MFSLFFAARKPIRRAQQPMLVMLREAVVSKYSNGVLRGVAVVVIEHSTQTLAPVDSPGRHAYFLPSVEDTPIEALVIRKRPAGDLLFVSFATG